MQNPAPHGSVSGFMQNHPSRSVVGEWSLVEGWFCRNLLATYNEQFHAEPLLSLLREREREREFSQLFHYSVEWKWKLFATKALLH